MFVSVALAKDNNGGGNGRGNGGGNGRGNGEGRGNGDGGKSSHGKDASGQSSSGTGAKGSGATVDVRGQDVVVRYKNGIVESVVNGIYTIKDSRGRKIATRKATRFDEARLRSLKK
jgi:hypothetical protein